MTKTMSKKIDVVRRSMEAAHELKVDEAISYYTDDAYYQFGGFPPAIGREAIRKNLYDTHVDIMKDLHVEERGIWEFDDAVILEMVVHITRTDDKVVEMPCVDVIRLTPDDRIRDVRVYIDPAPLLEGIKLPNAPGR